MSNHQNSSQPFRLTSFHNYKSQHNLKQKNISREVPDPCGINRSTHFPTEDRENPLVPESEHVHLGHPIKQVSGNQGRFASLPRSRALKGSQVPSGGRVSRPTTEFRQPYAQLFGDHPGIIAGHRSPLVHNKVACPELQETRSHLAHTR